MHDGHEGCHVTCNLGGSLIRNQRVRYEALQHFQEAARLEPANAQIRVKLGMLYKDAGMAKKAEACFWEALLLDGNNQAALMELGLEDKADSAKPETKKDLKKKIS
jgi:Flp pilus assembly protein TadD